MDGVTKIRTNEPGASCFQVQPPESSRRRMLKECLRKKRSTSKGVDSAMEKPTDLGSTFNYCGSIFFLELTSLVLFSSFSAE
jgi:hypothetical protein